MKECFGQLGNITIKWIQRSAVHVIRTDEEKMVECRDCELLAQCACEKNLAMFKEMIKLIDEQRPRKRGALS